jgi:hypothetical protein
MINTLYYGDNLEVREGYPAAGVHENELGRFPSLQILTPADLFHGAPAKLPLLAPINRRDARVETRASHKEGGQGSLL